MSSLDQKVSRCESIIEYTFTNSLLCATALNTTGNMVVWDDQFRVVPKNQNLGVYGDSITAATLCRMWFHSGLAKGSWTTIIQSVATNANFASVGFEHGLNDCVNLNAGTSSVSTGTMATTVEAILGAVHLDGGDAALTAVMGRLGLTHELLNQAVTLIFPFSPVSHETVYIPINV